MTKRALNLYRKCLRYSKMIPEAPQRQEAMYKTKTYFRKNRNEENAKETERLLKEAESSCTYMLTLIPTSHMSIEARQGHRHTQRGGKSSFIFDSKGNLTPGMREVVKNAPLSNWGDGNFDPDWIQKWQAQCERVQFRGPLWDKYRAGYNPYREFAKGPTLSDYLGEPDRYNSEIDWDNLQPHKDPKNEEYFRHARRSDFPGLSDEGHDYAPDYEIQKKWRKKYPGDHKPHDITEDEWQARLKAAETEPDPELEVDYSNMPEEPNNKNYHVGGMDMSQLHDSFEKKF